MASVTVSPVADTLLFGTKTQFTATVKDAAGHALTDRTVTWSSSDTAIATVSSNGLVTGVGPGSATITASAEGKDGVASITVRPLVFASVSAGGVHTCGLTTGGIAYCWGLNVLGQLGNGGITNESTPQAVAGGLTFQSLSAGGLHTCGLSIDAAAYCWGNNGNGQLGNGSADGPEGGSHPTPEAVSGGLTFQSLSAGRHHTCGVTTEGAAYCWGANLDGQLGNGSTTDKTAPEAVSGGLTFQSLSAGRAHTCGVATDGAGYCWGQGGSGRLGNGSTTDKSTPEAVAGGLTFHSVSAGRGHTCGIATDRAAYSWGSNGLGALGIGSAATASLRPALVPGGHSFASLSAGGDHSCGVTTGAVAYCWGRNDGGQLGIGFADLVSYRTPETVSTTVTFQSVNVGLFHSCGLTTDGAAYCWGWNTFGQLGSSHTTIYQPAPVLVLGQQ